MFVKNLFNFARISGGLRSRYSYLSLFVISMTESFISPIPPEALLLPMVHADKRNWLRIGVVCSVASVLGAVVGYYLAINLFKPLVVPMLDFYGYRDAFTSFSAKYKKYGDSILIIGALTPFPFKLVTITSGFVRADFNNFLAIVILVRSFRYLLFSYLLRLYGDRIIRYFVVNPIISIIFITLCFLLMYLYLI